MSQCRVKEKFEFEFEEERLRGATKKKCAPDDSHSECGRTGEPRDTGETNKRHSIITSEKT